MGQSRGSSICAESPAPGVAVEWRELGLGEMEGGQGGENGAEGWISRAPFHHLLLVKISDALERFRCVSLTARPLHQLGRRIRHRSCYRPLLSAASPLRPPRSWPAHLQPHQHQDLQPVSADCFSHPSGLVPMIYHTPLLPCSCRDTWSGKLLPCPPTVRDGVTKTGQGLCEGWGSPRGSDPTERPPAAAARSRLRSCGSSRRPRLCCGRCGLCCGSAGCPSSVPLPGTPSKCLVCCGQGWSLRTKARELTGIAGGDVSSVHRLGSWMWNLPWKIR